MGFYRKKPVVIEAVQWTGDNVREIANFAGTVHFRMDEFTIDIDTGEEMIKAELKDFIIRAPFNDEFYVCSPGLFMELYEEVTGAEWAQYRYDRETVSPGEAYKILLGETE